MTSKEFSRRLAIYRSLNKACGFFSPRCMDYIFRVTICCDNIVTVDYVDLPSFSLFDYGLISSCQYVSFDKFTYSEFKIQFGYFKSFISRLSSHQLNVLKASHDVDNLLKFHYEDSE